MLRDDSGNGGRRPDAARNVLGEPLDICSIKPMTGFYRDGCCNTGREDIGSHTVCVVLTEVPGATWLTIAPQIDGADEPAITRLTWFCVTAEPSV